MTAKTANVHARIQPTLKTQVEAVLEQLGLSMSEAISIYFNQISMRQGLPFDVKIPNAETRRAMEDVRKKRGLHKAKNAADLMKQIGV